ncbi:Sordarin/hypoxysordarin biosynthesis cluster protein P [Colletotrichum tropicale]|nr:Sordarin/hypoxysordarin biosynthesis cluster protein P [Colletotrichum tropicale]
MRNNNTSLPGFELAGPIMDMVNFYWESMQQLYAEHHIFLEILFTTSWWLRYLVPSWRRASNRKIVKHMKYPFIPLLAHLTCGTLAIIRYYYLYLALGDSPVPTLLDLAFSLGFTATGVQLSGYVREGNVPVLKAAFKAMAFQQAIATFAGYTYGSAHWHRAGIKVMNAFVWVRWFNEYGTVFQGFRTYGARFTASTVISHPLCMWEGDYPAGMPVYVAMLFAFLAVDKWAARKLDGKPGPIPRALAHCGFVTVEKKHRDVEKLGIAESEEKTGAKLE